MPKSPEPCLFNMNRCCVFCDPGEIDHVKDQLPEDIKEFWPSITTAAAAPEKPSSKAQLKAMGKPRLHHSTPRDDPLPGTVGTGEDICSECHGSGKGKVR